jgi:AcrR family transcriptional regulator
VSTQVKPKPSPAPAPRNRLSREEVASSALAYLDRHGLDGLSMRRLAGELGVGTMTLYGYFRSKDELLDAVVDAAVADRPAAPLEGDWPDRLRRLMGDTREALGRHPALVQLRVQRPVLRPEALRFCELTMEILTGAGFSHDDAAQAFRLFFTYVFGYAAFSPAGSEEEAAQRSRTAMRALAPEEYPVMTAAGDQLARAMAGGDTFDFGLDLIIGGLEQRLAAAR